MLEGALLRAPVPVIMDGDFHAVEAAHRVAVFEMDDPVGVIKGQAAVESTVYDAEHRRRQTNPERQCENGYRTNARALEQQSRPVAHIFPELVHSRAALKMEGRSVAL